MVYRRLPGKLVLGFVLAVAGCGGSDDARDRDEIEQVLTESMNAAHAGDRERACSSYTSAYVREALKENAGLKLERRTCAELVGALHVVLKQLTPDPKPSVSDVDLSGDAATARMEIDTAFGLAASKIFVVRRDGTWKIEHDEDLRGKPESPTRRRPARGAEGV